MDLSLSDDQRMLKNSVDRLILERYAFDQRAGYAAAPDGWSRDMWAAFVELGLTMLPFAEEQGGLGLGGVETMLVGEAFGRGLVVEPYLSSIVLAGTAIATGGSPEQINRWLTAIMAGRVIAAFADDAAIAARAADRGFRLTGKATLVLGGDDADLFVLPADGALFVVPARTIGLSRRGYRLHGGGSAADLILDDVVVGGDGRLAVPGAATRAVEAGIAFLAAEAVGVMQAALDACVDYLKVRVQFGKPIAASQALQHRAAEMLVEVEQARSAAIYAALLDAEPAVEERARGFAAIKAVIGQTARFVGQNAVQLHGGIGVSEEHIVGHYFLRLTSICHLLGDADTHLARLAELGGFTGAQSTAG